MGWVLLEAVVTLIPGIQTEFSKISLSQVDATHPSSPTNREILAPFTFAQLWHLNYASHDLYRNNTKPQSWFFLLASDTGVLLPAALSLWEKSWVPTMGACFTPLHPSWKYFPPSIPRTFLGMSCSKYRTKDWNCLTFTRCWPQSPKPYATVTWHLTWRRKCNFSNYIQ